MLKAVDSGKHSLKIFDEEMKDVLIIRNKMHIGFQELLSPKSYNVVHNGKGYVVGRAGRKADTVEGKVSDHHLITTLTGLAQTNITEPIQLLYSESAARYKTNKDAIVEKFTGVHNIEVNGTKHTITINSVLVLPEGVGYVLGDILNNQKIVYILDIGGLTSQFLMIDCGSPQRMISLKMGMTQIVNKIYMELNAMGYDFYTPEQIEQDIEMGAKNPEVAEVINRVIKEQLKSIHTELLEQGINLNNVPELVCVGGTVKRLEKEIKESYKNAIIPEDAQTVHVKGMLKYGMAIAKRNKVKK